MKKIYIYISTLLLLFNLFPVQAQVNKGDYIINIDRFDIFSGVNGCCNTETLNDFSFEYNMNSALLNQELIKSAMNARLNAWRIRQEGILKQEIERQLGNTFSNYTDARNAYFKKIETDFFNSNKYTVKNKYYSKSVKGVRTKIKHVRNLKMLKLRENEIISGNINNSLLANLNYSGTPLNQITNINQLQTLWQSEFNLFSDTSWKYHNDLWTSRYLQDLIYANNSHPIFTDLLNLQVQYYNSFNNIWDRINFMQLYLQHINDSLIMIALPVRLNKYATPTFIENYAASHRSGGISIFDPDYPALIALDYLYLFNGQWEGQYEALDYAEMIADQEREEALNNMLNAISAEELKVQSVISILGYGVNSPEAVWLNNHINQGVQVFNYLDENTINNQLNADAQNFGMLAVEAKMNEDEVDYSLEIIIKKKLNDDYPCHANVISEAYGVCSPLTQIVLDVFEANDGTNLTFDYGNISGGSAANTYPIFVYNSSTNTCDVNIKFRESYLQFATDISIARTTIHESLHAILVYMYESNMYELPSGTVDPTFNDFFEAYTFFVAGTTPTVGLSQNEVQHNYIINFVDDIATSLSNYAERNGYTYSFNYYKTLAWGGLMGTQTFKNLYPKYIDPSDATINPGNVNPEWLNIINSIAAEQENSTYIYNHPNGNTYENSPKGTAPNTTIPCN